MKKLNIGCGKDIRPGYVNIDMFPLSDEVDKVDVNWGLPYPDNTFDEVVCYKVMASVDDMLYVMREIHRVCKPNALVYCKDAYYNCQSSHSLVANKRFFSYISYDRLIDYYKMSFSIVEKEFVYTRFGKYLPFRSKLALILGEIASEVKVTLKVVK
jgi:SAM-dependent methyltransferase